MPCNRRPTRPYSMQALVVRCMSVTASPSCMHIRDCGSGQVGGQSRTTSALVGLPRGLLTRNCQESPLDGRFAGQSEEIHQRFQCPPTRRRSISRPTTRSLPHRIDAVCCPWHLLKTLAWAPLRFHQPNRARLSGRAASQAFWIAPQMPPLLRTTVTSLESWFPLLWRGQLGSFQMVKWGPGKQSAAVEKWVALPPQCAS